MKTERRCEHDSNSLINDKRMKVFSIVAGNTYYIDKITNEIFCSCGVEADFPHKCKRESN